MGKRPGIPEDFEKPVNETKIPNRKHYGNMSVVAM